MEGSALPGRDQTGSYGKNREQVLPTRVRWFSGVTEGPHCPRPFRREGQRCSVAERGRAAPTEGEDVRQEVARI